MGPKTEELIEVLGEIMAVLEEDAEEHWYSWISQCRDRILKSDYSGVEKLLGCYGGMGSFNDLVIAQTRVNGEFACKPNAREKNNRLDELRSKAYELATCIKQDQIR